MRKFVFLAIVYALFLQIRVNACEQEPLQIKVLSSEYMTITGSFEFTAKYFFLDSISFSETSFFELPSGWTANFNPEINGSSFNKNDSIIVTISINYPINNVPYFVQYIVFKHRVRILNSLPDDYYDISFSVMVYFTPYNTIEIWNM